MPVILAFTPIKRQIVFRIDNMRLRLNPRYKDSRVGVEGPTLAQTKTGADIGPTAAYPAIFITERFAFGAPRRRVRWRRIL